MAGVPKEPRRRTFAARQITRAVLVALITLVVLAGLVGYLR
jgi:hypothetical protein